MKTNLIVIEPSVSNGTMTDEEWDKVLDDIVECYKHPDVDVRMAVKGFRNKKPVYERIEERTWIEGLLGINTCEEE